MNPLTPDNIPTSFTGQALLAGAQSVTLNPPNESQNDADIWIGKPARLVARLVYLVVIGFFVAPVGFLYHCGASIYRGCQSLADGDKQKLFEILAWEHLKASLQDLTSIVCIIFSTFSVDPTKGTSFRFSSTKVYIEELGTEQKFDYYIKSWLHFLKEPPATLASRKTQFHQLQQQVLTKPKT